MRILANGEWFEPVSSESQYETEFESLILARSDVLFPEFHVVPFKLAVESELGRRIPDLALVDREYRKWWVVEVELAHHSLYGHVMPQVEVFARGRYTEEHTDHLYGVRNDLDRAALQDMVKGHPPRVLVIVNRNVPQWVEPIHRLEGIVTVVEIFRSDRNRHLLRVNGDYPQSEEPRLVSRCRLDRALPNLLLLDSPATLAVRAGEALIISFDDGLTSWSRIDTADRVWLVPSGREPASCKPRVCDSSRIGWNSRVSHHLD